MQSEKARSTGWDDRLAVSNESKYLLIVKGNTIRDAWVKRDQILLNFILNGNRPMRTLIGSVHLIVYTQHITSCITRIASHMRILRIKFIFFYSHVRLIQFLFLFCFSNFVCMFTWWSKYMWMNNTRASIQLHSSP